MKSRSRIMALPVALAALLIAAACSKQEAEPAAAAPEHAAAAADATADAPDDAAPRPASAVADGEAGATTYATYCVTCHGAGGRGDGVAAAGLAPKPADFVAGAFRIDANGNGAKGEIEDIKAVIRDGAAKHGGSPLMAPWPMLSADQLQAVAEHVRSLQEG